MNRIVIGILSFAVAASAVCAPASSRHETAPGLTSGEIALVRDSLPPLSFEGQRTWTPNECRFLDHYKLNTTNAVHHFGVVPVGSQRIAAHAFIPPDARGTVLLVHGYYDHAGVVRRLIHDLVARRYGVVVYDQPGHGLSSGARATIGDFSEYVAVLRAMATLTAEQMPGPVHVVAHSMGCAITVDYLLSVADARFRRVVFLAPLIRSAHWKVSGFGNRIAGSMIDKLPRVFRKNSSDPQFLAFHRKDPLQSREVPLAWVQALAKWNRRFEDFPASVRGVLVVQGDKDTTVDWRYNLPALRRKLPRATVHVVKGAGHQLVNEAPSLRARVLRLVGRHLEAAP